MRTKIGLLVAVVIAGLLMMGTTSATNTIKNGAIFGQESQESTVGIPQVEIKLSPDNPFGEILAGEKAEVLKFDVINNGAGDVALSNIHIVWITEKTIAMDCPSLWIEDELIEEGELCTQVSSPEISWAWGEYTFLETHQAHPVILPPYSKTSFSIKRNIEGHGKLLFYVNQIEARLCDSGLPIPVRGTPVVGKVLTVTPTPIEIFLSPDSPSGPMISSARVTTLKFGLENSGSEDAKLRNIDIRWYKSPCEMNISSISLWTEDGEFLGTAEPEEYSSTDTDGECRLTIEDALLPAGSRETFSITGNIWVEKSAIESCPCVFSVNEIEAISAISGEQIPVKGLPLIGNTLVF